MPVDVFFPQYCNSVVLTITQGSAALRGRHADLAQFAASQREFGSQTVNALLLPQGADCAVVGRQPYTKVITFHFEAYNVPPARK